MTPAQRIAALVAALAVTAAGIAYSRVRVPASAAWYCSATDSTLVDTARDFAPLKAYQRKGTHQPIPRPTYPGGVGGELVISGPCKNVDSVGGIHIDVGDSVRLRQDSLPPVLPARVLQALSRL